LLQIRSELAGLVGDEVADFRLVEPAPIPEPIMEAELMPKPISVVVPGAVLAASASLVPGRMVALPTDPEPQVPSGGRVVPWQRPTVTRYLREYSRRAG
jgi:hypothetical protein